MKEHELSKVKGGQQEYQRKELSPNMSLISIITVVYNGEEFIEETLLSVINQDYQNIEYIIIDGGSSDGSVEIIKRYQYIAVEKGIIFKWLSEQDAGIYDAMNKGIELATGEWINFMNTGDLFHSEETLNRVFSEKGIEQAQIIYGNTNLIYDLDLSVVERANPFLSEDDFKNVTPVCHQSTFINTKLHKDERFNLLYKIHADHYFFYSQFKKGIRFKYVDMVISDFDRSGVSTNLTMSQIKERYQICSELNTDFSKFIFCLRYTKSIIKKLFKKIIPIKLFHKLEVFILTRQ